MSIESSSDDSADIFWPGYVDAVSNLVLNLLFVLTIMIVAVFMFALQLSRHTNEERAETSAKVKNAVEVITKKEEEIAKLQREIELLKSKDELKVDAVSPQKIATVKTQLAKPLKDVDKLLQDSGGVIVHFIEDAVTLNDSEVQQVHLLFKPFVTKGQAKIFVDVPTGFSEAKRIAFYRAMAVRNQLIELGIPSNKLEIQIREGKSSADNSKVLVTE